MKNNYYEILEVREDASLEVIKASYRILAKKYHPDKSSETSSEEQMQMLNKAYETLSNSEQRKIYDLYLIQLKKQEENSKEEELFKTTQKQIFEKERVLQAEYEKKLNKKIKEAEIKIYEKNKQENIQSFPQSNQSNSYIQNQPIYVTPPYNPNFPQQPYPYKYNKKKSTIIITFSFMMYFIILFVIVDFIFSISNFNYSKFIQNNIIDKAFINQKSLQHQNKSLSDNYNLGIKSLEEQKYKEALKYFYSSAKEGNYLAANQIGYMYLNGYGISKNPQEAYKWFKVAADKNQSEGQFYLGYLNFYGIGIDKNLKEAHYWLTLSSNQGNQDAQKLLDQINLN